MSAFFVDDRVYFRTAQFVAEAVTSDNPSNSCYWPIRHLFQELKRSGVNCSTRSIKVLAYLNYLAVSGRYPNDDKRNSWEVLKMTLRDIDKIKGGKYCTESRKLETKKAVNVYKWLKCIRYQCLEDAVCDYEQRNEVLKVLEKALPIFASHILEATPEYNHGAWGEL